MFTKLLSFFALIKGTVAASAFAKVLRKIANFIAPRKKREEAE